MMHKLKRGGVSSSESAFVVVFGAAVVFWTSEIIGRVYGNGVD